MPNYFKLPLSFDAAGLKSDLDGLRPGDWVAHFNTRYYEGDWSAAALRSVGGAADKIYPDPASAEPFADTEILSRCPNVRRALDEIKCPLNSVRLLRLGAGALIREHKDYNLSLEDGEIGLHIPVVTNPMVNFFLGGERLAMGEGECWYLNLNLPHKVENLGATARAHLVIHCVVNDWVREMIGPDREAAAGREPASRAAAPSSPESFKNFRRLVLEDVELQRRLREKTDVKDFIVCITEMGRERGYHFSAEDVEEALSASRRAWAERWI